MRLNIEKIIDCIKDIKENLMIEFSKYEFK